MSKLYLIPTLLFTLFFTACGQKGALYLPKDTTSEIPTQTADNSNNANNPNDLTNVQNPNIKLQDSKHDY